MYFQPEIIYDTIIHVQKLAWDFVFDSKGRYKYQSCLRHQVCQAGQAGQSP
jgi:hypothetical protein